MLSMVLNTVKYEGREPLRRGSLMIEVWLLSSVSDNPQFYVHPSLPHCHSYKDYPHSCFDYCLSVFLLAEPAAGTRWEIRREWEDQPINKDCAAEALRGQRSSVVPSFSAVPWRPRGSGACKVCSVDRECARWREASIEITYFQYYFSKVHVIMTPFCIQESIQCIILLVFVFKWLGENINFVSIFAVWSGAIFS